MAKNKTFKPTRWPLRVQLPLKTFLRQDWLNRSYFWSFVRLGRLTGAQQMSLLKLFEAKKAPSSLWEFCKASKTDQRSLTKFRETVREDKQLCQRNSRSSKTGILPGTNPRVDSGSQGGLSFVYTWDFYGLLRLIELLKLKFINFFKNILLYENLQSLTAGLQEPVLYRLYTSYVTK